MRKANQHFEDFDKAFSYCLLLLRYRSRSEKEIFSRLAQKGYSPKISKKVAIRLSECGLLDDANFAREFVQYGFEKGWGRKKIEFQLQKFGICKDKSDFLLKDLNYKEKIKDIIETKKKNRPQVNPATGARERARLVRILAARGYDYGDIFSVLNDNK